MLIKVTTSSAYIMALVDLENSEIMGNDLIKLTDNLNRIFYNLILKHFLQTAYRRNYCCLLIIKLWDILNRSKTYSDYLEGSKTIKAYCNWNRKRK